jgi:hypothetical protein
MTYLQKVSGLNLGPASDYPDSSCDKSEDRNDQNVTGYLNQDNFNVTL